MAGGDWEIGSGYGRVEGGFYDGGVRGVNKEMGWGSVQGSGAALCIGRFTRWRDQVALVTWLLDAMLSPNEAEPNG